LVLALVVVMAACSTEMSLRQLTEAEQAINNRLNTWVRALNNSELDTLLLMHHQVPELMVILGDGTEAMGWSVAVEGEVPATTGRGPAVQDMYRQLFSNIDRMNVAMQGPRTEILSLDFAITTLRHSTDVIYADGERAPPVAGHVTIFWVRDRMDDEWKIHLTHWSYKPPSVN